MAVTFPAPPHRWESRGLLSLCAAFSFWFILLCWKAARIRGQGTAFSSVLPAAALQIQRARLCAGTTVGEMLCASNSRYSSARIFYQQRSRGECKSCQAFFAIPCARKGESSEGMAPQCCVLLDLWLQSCLQSPRSFTLAVPSGYGQGVLKEKWVDIGE